MNHAMPPCGIGCSHYLLFKDEVIVKYKFKVIIEPFRLRGFFFVSHDFGITQYSPKF